MHCYICMLLSLASLSRSMSLLNSMFIAARVARRIVIVAQIFGALEEEGPMKPRQKSHNMISSLTCCPMAILTRYVVVVSSFAAPKWISPPRQIGVANNPIQVHLCNPVSCDANPHPGTSLQLLNPQCLYGSAPHVYASHISLNMHFATTQAH